LICRPAHARHAQDFRDSRTAAPGRADHEKLASIDQRVELFVAVLELGHQRLDLGGEARRDLVARLDRDLVEIDLEPLPALFLLLPEDLRLLVEVVVLLANPPADLRRRAAAPRSSTWSLIQAAQLLLARSASWLQSSVRSSPSSGSSRLSASLVALVFDRLVSKTCGRPSAL
jgi:hypothetical protein